MWRTSHTCPSGSVNAPEVPPHTEGFRSSPSYQEWRALLHHFYDPFPTVEHYEQVHSA